MASNLNWTLGKHTLKFGGEYNHLFADQFFQFNQFGRFIVSGSASTDGGVRTILGIIGANPAGNVNRFNSTAVTYLLNIGNGLLDMTQEEVAFFVEDTWRITPRLTITPGLRWEGYFNPQPDVSNSALYNSVRNFGFPIGRTVDPAGIPDNTDQVMPRLGIAWDPWGDSKTVIRANAGLYYARIPLLLFAGPLNNFRTPAGDLSVALPFRLASGAGISNCGQLGLTPLFTGDNCNTVYAQLRRIGIDLNNSSLGNLPQLTPAQLTQIATALGLAVDPNRGAQPIAMANNFEAPHSFQWGVGIEREVSRGWSVGADYVYVNTIHLQRNTDYNLPTPLICTGAPLPAGCTSADLSLRPCFGIAGSSACNGRARPIATLGSVQIRESNSRALYQGFTLRSNFRRGRYNFQSYYTLSYNNSDDDNERDAGGQGAANAFALQQEYGRSRLDVRHLVLVNGVVDLPAGFQVGALGRWRSSRPIDPTTGGDTNGDNFSTDRAFQAIGIPFERNSFRDRAVFDTDLRVSWNAFRLLSKLRPNENSRLLVTADIFNLFNYDNVVYTSGASGGSNRNYGVGVSTAGAIVPANASFQRLRVATACSSNPNCYDTNNSTARIYNFQVQFGVRFEF